MRYLVAIRSKDAGFTMVEMVIAMMILVVAITGLLATIIPATQLIMVNRETTIAMGAAMGMIEYMSDPDIFSDLFALYNRNPTDDPDVGYAEGGAPGQHFVVPVLNPVEGDPDGMVGAIYFPTFCTTPGDVETEQLLENKLDAEYTGYGIDTMLGLPRDLGPPVGLDADLNHAEDYYLLPVIIRLEWTGVAGERDLMMYTLIAER